MTPEQRRSCSEFLQRSGPSTLHHGDAIGADAEAHRIATDLGYRTIIHPGLTDTQRAFCLGDEIREPQDFMTRNRAIVDEAAILVAAPYCAEFNAPRSGTWRTVRYARQLGKSVTVIWPDGRIADDTFVSEHNIA